METPVYDIEKEIFNHGIEIAYTENEARDTLTAIKRYRATHYSQLSELQFDLEVTKVQDRADPEELSALREDVEMHSIGLAEFDVHTAQINNNIQRLGEAVGVLIGREA